jgi:hypothetical protein
MLSRLKQLFKRRERDPEKREVHDRERTERELRAEAQHAAHSHGVSGGHAGLPGGS